MSAGVNVADIYELTPLQQELLGQARQGAEEAARLVQQAVYASGALDEAALARSWREVVGRHPVLRTIFHWEGLERPVQVVRRHIEPPLGSQDLRALSAVEVDERLSEYLQVVRSTGFRLDQAPLACLTLCRVGPDAWRIVWSYHRLILDSQSASQVLGEVLRGAALHGGRPLLATSPPAYRDHIVWIQRQDPAGAEAFWREALRGWQRTPPPGSGAPAEELGPFAELKRLLPLQQSAALQALAEECGTTVETLLHGAWGLLLGRYAGSEDVVFGAAVAGRPALPGAAALVGPFANTVPLRVRLPADEPVRAWLSRLHAEREKARPYEHIPPGQVRAWAGGPEGTPLFETRLVVTSRAGTSALGKAGLRLQRKDMPRPRQPLTLSVVPTRRGLQLRLVYDTRRLDAGTATSLAGRFQAALAYLVAHPAHRLGEVSLLKYLPGPLVELQPAGNAAPLFLVHPVGGGLLAYAPLVRHLGQGRPIYGFRSVTADLRQPPQHRVGRMAARYLAALRAVQPQGPYLLGGWSLGGLVAFEMARQLLEQGQQVALLALLDTAVPPPPTEQAAQVDFTRSLREFAWQIGLRLPARWLERIPPRRQPFFVLRKAKQHSLLPPNTTVRGLVGQVRRVRADMEAGRAYPLAPSPLRVTLFGAAVTRQRGAEPSLGWDRYAAAVDLHVVPGNHHTLLREPHVTALGEALRACLPDVRTRVIR
jgi:thioesterase domain-containing protein